MNILYSTNCPRCKQLKKMLDDNNISYKEINDKLIMKENGFERIPMFEVDNKIMDYNSAINWIKENR